MPQLDRNEEAEGWGYVMTIDVGEKIELKCRYCKTDIVQHGFWCPTLKNFLCEECNTTREWKCEFGESQHTHWNITKIKVVFD